MKSRHRIDEFIPQVSIDCVVFGYEQTTLKVLIGKLDFNGEFHALPGGFIRHEEGIDEAALRILQERTGIREIYLEQFKVYGDATRDTRSFYEELLAGNPEKLKEIGADSAFLTWCQQRFLSIGYYALVDMRKVKPQATLLAESFDWYDITALPDLIMDHRDIVDGALEALQFQLDRKLIAFNMLPETFTMRQLRELYEAVYDRPFRSNNFQKKMLSLDILERLGKKYTGAKHKAPYLYRFRKSADYAEASSAERS